MNPFAPLLLSFLFLNVCSREVDNEIENFDFVNETTLEPFARIRYPDPGTRDETSEFLVNYNSYKPVAVLVDDTLGAHKDASKFMMKLFELHPSVNNIDFVFLEFNSSGISSVLETTRNNLERFKTLLEGNKAYGNIGCSNNKTLAFYAILKTVQILDPFNGILMFIDRSYEENLAQLAVQAAWKKKIRIFVRWSGSELINTNTLKDLVRNTRGQFYVSRDSTLSSQNHKLFLDSCLIYQNATLLLSKHNLTGENSFNISIQPNVTGIHLMFYPDELTGILIAPTGETLNISDAHQIASFSKGSFGVKEGDIRNIQLNMTSSRKLLVGTWNLKLKLNGIYGVEVFVLSKLGSPSEKIYQAPNDQQLESYSYVNSEYPNKDIPVQPVTVEVGLGSELITTGQKLAEIYFEVTNSANTAVDARFHVNDQQYILAYMQPFRKVISPRETTIVRVTLNTKPGTYQDDITFSVQTGAGVIQKKVLVDVGGAVVKDNTDPDIDYRFTSDCTEVLFSNCESGHWSVEVWATDRGSGLFQLSSSPKGLYFPNGYTTGTRERVTGYYGDSCCNPDLQIFAVDRLQNRKQKHINAYWATWSAGAIAAIILGILLLIIIICVIVWLVRRNKKEKGRYDLPTYRGGKI